MKKNMLAVLMGAVLAVVSVPSSHADMPQSGSPDSDDYTTIQQGLQQDRLSDALRRISMLEQQDRFLSKRIELLERDVNDIKNDKY